MILLEGFGFGLGSVDRCVENGDGGFPFTFFLP
jgi:hypothetical protein